jgi:hypothetical protein
MKKKELRRTMMIDFESMYGSLTNELSGNQKKLNINSAIGVYYGLSKEGNYRLAFLSSSVAPKIESTKMIRVTQGEEAANTYWTCFDLLQCDAKKVFFAFCANLIEAITDVYNEQRALYMLKKRFIIWKTMFKRDSVGQLSRETIQGLFGELYFMKKYMLGRFGAAVAVQAWSGPDAKSKDYAVDTEWFEVKTVGANTSTVHISSLAQLSSDHDGHLIVIKAEAMSDQFSNGESSIGELFDYIFAQINDETAEGIFLSKLSAFGFDSSDESFMSKFDVKSMTSYKVSGDFPRLTEKDITRPELCDVSYSLIINSLKDYTEDLA